MLMMSLDMIECARCYPEVLLISCSRKRKNKYGLFQIHFSSVNNFGRVVILGLGLTNIKCKPGYVYMFNHYIQKLQEEQIPLPKVVVTNLDMEVIEA